MQEMVNIYVYGKKYSVPGDLTIMTAMEYAGYQLKRGCGCRHGFCGACATIYRIKGKNELKTCLACQTQVEDGMYIASLPFYPIDKRTYDIEEISAEQRVMMDLYPEIYSCVGCCASRCPAGISHPMVGELARRLNGKYIAPKAEHLKNRVEEIHEGKFDDLIEQVMGKPIDEIQELYNNREIEK